MAARHESLFDAEETQRIFRGYSRDVLDGLIADLRDGREHVREQTRLVPSRAQLGGTNAPRRQVGCISFYHDAIVGNFLDNLGHLFRAALSLVANPSRESDVTPEREEPSRFVHGAREAMHDYRNRQLYGMRSLRCGYVAGDLLDDGTEIVVRLSAMHEERPLMLYGKPDLRLEPFPLNVSRREVTIIVEAALPDRDTIRVANQLRDGVKTALALVNAVIALQ